MKNILIVGGRYFAGRVLVQRLLKENSFRVFVFNRGNAPMAHDGLTCLVGDRENMDHIKHNIPAKQWDLDHHLVYSAIKIQKSIGFYFTPIEIGMKQTYQHYNSMLKL